MLSPPPAGSSRRCAQCRVLVAHERSDLRRFVGAAVRADGYGEVATARSGYDVVSQLASWMLRDGRPADLLVLAARLEGWTGTDLASGIQGTPWAAPCILLADRGDENATQRARQLGIPLFCWPFEPEDLRTVALYQTHYRRTTYPAGQVLDVEPGYAGRHALRAMV